MKEYTTGHLLSSLGADAEKFPGELLSGGIAGVSTDSRTIKKGDVFFAQPENRERQADKIVVIAFCAVNFQAFSQNGKHHFLRRGFTGRSGNSNDSAGKHRAVIPRRIPEGGMRPS